MPKDLDLLTQKLSPSQAEMLSFAELFFFAYRDFISEPDSILKKYGFGRAHHRVLHFVSRNSGLRVSELLDILKITKQSLARILKQLIDEGFIEQRTNSADKRARYLYPTPEGLDLMKDLITPQLDRLSQAFQQSNQQDKAMLQDFFLRMITADEQDQVRNRIFKTTGDT